MKTETFEIPFTLKPDAGGTRAVVLTVQATDLADAVRVACHRMRYQGWLEHEFAPFLEHHRRPEPEPSKPYCVPHCSGLGSEPAAVARLLGDVLSALGRINDLVAAGVITDDLRQFRLQLHERLQAEGWRIKAKTHQGWRVLPPKGR